MKNIAFILCLFLTLNLQGQDITGAWNGALDIQGTQLRIVFNISELEGKLTTTMDSPDQGAKGIPTDETSFEDGKLTITSAKMGLEYNGVLADGKVEGIFNQNGMSIPLVLDQKKIEKKVIIRSQTPKDFPYLQEDVVFVNPKGGHKLAGTLTSPKEGFEKVVVLVSGSGPQDRNEELLGHQTFLVLSDHLTRKGIAVLRYDDRGVAESEGDFSTASSKDFADDASAAVNYLTTRSEMQGKKIGIAGHSEGGMIAPIVATENAAVDFIVLLAGPGIDIPELLLLQTDLISEAAGVPLETRKQNAEMSSAAFDYLKRNPSLEKKSLEAGLLDVFRNSFEKMPEEAKLAAEGDFEKQIKSQSKVMLSDWFLYFIRFEPSRYLSKVTCPVLAINGEKDLQVTSKENLKGIKKSLKKAKNKNVTIKEFPDLNHLFQKAETGSPDEYGKIDETFNEEALNFISNWIINHD